MDELIVHSHSKVVRRRQPNSRTPILKTKNASIV